MPRISDIAIIDTMQAKATSVMSNPNFTYPKSFLNRNEMTFTKYSPAIIAMLAFTSNAIPAANIMHPAISAATLPI